MSSQELFARLTGALNHAGIAYMFTGSFASSFHGTPRASNDFDIVIAPTPEQLRQYIEHWIADLHVEEQWRQALNAAGL